MLIILFGLAGSGKNFVGEILANHFGYYFWDADAILPVNMQDSIKQKKAFTQTMRDEFTQALIKKIHELFITHKKLVIAQALYKECNREMIQNEFPDAIFILVKADPKIISHRIKNRKSVVDEEYAKKIQSNFEMPLLKHNVIDNNSDENAILLQLNKVIK